MNKYVRNMTQGSELRHILMFTLPLLAGNLFQQFYNIVDSVIVGRYLGHDTRGNWNKIQGYRHAFINYK